jgi:hypothetical protein
VGTSVTNPVSFQTVSRLQSSDYPNGLKTQDDVGKLLAQLAPLVSNANSSSTQEITRESQTFAIQTPSSDWQPLTQAPRNGWTSGSGTPVAGQDGSQPSIAWRIDDAGNVQWFGNLSSLASSGNTVFNAADFPAITWPEVNIDFCVLAQVTAASWVPGRATFTAAGGLIIGEEPVSTANYSFLITYPSRSRVPGFMGSLRAQAQSGVGFPFSVQFSRTIKPASVRLSLVESSQDPNAGQKTVWQLGVQPPHVAHGVTWSWLGGGKVAIDAIPGLALGTKYNATVEAFY